MNSCENSSFSRAMAPSAITQTEFLPRLKHMPSFDALLLVDLMCPELQLYYTPNANKIKSASVSIIDLHLLKNQYVSLPKSEGPISTNSLFPSYSSQVI